MVDLSAAVLKYINVNEKQKLYVVGLYYFKEEQCHENKQGVGLAMLAAV